MRPLAIVQTFHTCLHSGWVGVYIQCHTLPDRPICTATNFSNKIENLFSIILKKVLTSIPDSRYDSVLAGQFPGNLRGK